MLVLASVRKIHHLTADAVLFWLDFATMYLLIAATHNKLFGLIKYNWSVPLQK